VNYNQIATAINFKHVDDMYAALGAGDVRLAQVINAAHLQVEPNLKSKKQLDLSLLNGKTKAATGTGNDVQIAGVGNLLTTIASCCKPVPGDPITGFITLSRGVSVHRQDCLNIMNMAERDRQRIIEVNWSSNSAHTYPVDIFIEAVDRSGLLSEVIMVLGNEHVNLGNIITNVDKKTHSATIAMTIDIPRLELLGRILDKISQLPNVLDVRRQKNG
jgi:GTP pyrophosphokinase